MNKIYLTARTLAILMLVVILAACTTPTVVVQPTQDIPAVRTEVAKTVVAKVTIEAALNPSATPAAAQVVVVTATPDAAAPAATVAAPAIPTATVAATAAAPAATLVPTLRPVTSGGGSGTGTGGTFINPTATRRAGPDLAQMLSQEPADGARFNAGESFDAKFTFKNTGTSTWTSGFEYRFASGTNLSDKKKYIVPATVKPGETVTLIIDMLAPPQAGRYTSHWELVNVNGDVFYQFFVVIDVNE